MSVKLFVGNLSYFTIDETLSQVFSQYGTVLEAIVMRDRDTGQSRGFGYVTMSTNQEADAAIAGLNDTELEGRTIKVSRSSTRPLA